MRNLVTLLISPLNVAGCVSQTRGSVPAQSTQYLTAAVKRLPPISPASPNDRMTAKSLTDAKKDSFTVIDKEGEAVYCRSELRTGSHAVRDMTCQTAKQMDQLHEGTRADLQNYLKANAPPTGK